MRSTGERGQVSTDYAGVLAVVAVVFVAFFSVGVDDKVSGAVRQAVCTIVGSGCDAGGGPSGGTTDAQLAAREQALAPLGARGGNFQQQLAQARAARERGDSAEADRILDRLELYAALAREDRGDLIDALAGPSDGDFDTLVDQGTIDEEGRNRRYFRVPVSPGDGVIVMDFFIPTKNSGPLKGDDRDTADPLLGDVPLDRSRVVIVIDRESGRGVITQTKTCAADAIPGNYCEDPRPIELRDPITRPQINPLPGPQGANEFRVDGGDGSLELEYDALNSITPVGVSVDGTVRFERGPDGYYRPVKDTRDPYPRIVTGQYRPGRPPRIIDETEDEPVLPGALPGPVRDTIHGVGEIKDRACDLPIPIPGPVGLPPIGPVRDLVCR